MKKKLFLIIIPVFFILAPIFFVYFKQEEMLFKSSHLDANHKFSYESPFEEITLKTSNGGLINALHFKVNNPKGVILFCHGRGKNMERSCDYRSKIFTSKEYDFFIFDYRGFGKSKGKRNEINIYNDALECYQYLESQYSEENIIIYGRSLGTGIATYVASKTSPNTLILESPYYSVLELAPAQIPYIPRFLIPFVLKYHLRSDLNIQKVRAPIIIFHGTEDVLIPFNSSTRLLEKALLSNSKKLVPLPNLGHSGLSKSPIYITEIDSILLKD